MLHSCAHCGLCICNQNPVFDIQRSLFPRVQVHGINGGRWCWPWAGLCGGLLGSSPPGCVDFFVRLFFVRVFLSGYGFAAYSTTSVTIEQSLASIPSPTSRSPPLSCKPQMQFIQCSILLTRNPSFWWHFSKRRWGSRSSMHGAGRILRLSGWAACCAAVQREPQPLQ